MAIIPKKRPPEGTVFNRNVITDLKLNAFNTVVNRVGVVFDGDEPVYSI